MYIFLKNRNSCWDNNDKKYLGLFFFFSKIVTVWVRTHFRNPDNLSYDQSLWFVCLFSDFLILAFLLFFMWSDMLWWSRKQNSAVWPSTTGFSCILDSGLEVLKSTAVTLQELKQKKYIRVASMSVVPKLRAFEAGVQRNVQAGYPHLQLLNCFGKAS